MNKTEQLLAYFVANHHEPTVTSLIKLCYLVDLVSMKKRDTQISSFEYVRYYYGPFDRKIYQELHSLLSQGVITANLGYSNDDSEYVKYAPASGIEDLTYPDISKEEREDIESVLTALRGYGAKALTDVAYSTKPMEALGAKLGGNENLNVRLDLALQ
jgi:uncharacterized phage-associated protein